MPEFAFNIRELEGSRREVELIDRAMPYRPIEFGGEQHHVQRWYSGNSVATVQALGARENDLTINGTWKFRYIFNQVRLVGFDDIVAGAFDRAVEFPNLTPPIFSAEDLVQAFTRLRISANTVQVNWGPEVRQGILSKFVPSYERVEDIAWSATFVWTKRGARKKFRAAAPVDPRSDIIASVSAVDDTLAAEPVDLLATESEAIQASAAELRSSSLSLAQLLADANEEATAITQRAQAIDAMTSRVVQAGQALRGRADPPYIDLLPLDTVSLVTETEVWKRLLSRDTTRTQAAAVRARNSVTAGTDVQSIVQVRENENLRTIALRHLGSADAWTTIADANNLVGSEVAPGTQIIIPRAAAASEAV